MLRTFLVHLKKYASAVSVWLIFVVTRERVTFFSKAFLFWLKRAFVVFFGGSILLIVLYRWINPLFTPLMMIRFVDQLVDGRELVLQQQWVSIEKISPNVVYAVVAGEDQRFVSHIGFDFSSMYAALEYNFEHKTIGMGGSTISQQTAKNVFLWPSRSLLRKGLEAYCTLFMEVFWSKERILEVYLNIIEFGDGIYGIEAAAQKYFHTSAAKLSVSQAAFLSAMLPNPRYFEDHLRDYWLLRRKSNILRNIGTVKRNSETRGFVRTLK